MSQENVEIVQAIYAAWERGDFSSADWALSDIEFRFADGPEPGRWRGREAIGRGRTSGVEFGQRSVANLFEVEDGLVTRLVIYWDRNRALANLGLSE